MQALLQGAISYLVVSPWPVKLVPLYRHHQSVHRQCETFCLRKTLHLHAPLNAIACPRSVCRNFWSHFHITELRSLQKVEPVKSVHFPKNRFRIRLLLLKLDVCNINIYQIPKMVVTIISRCQLIVDIGIIWWKKIVELLHHFIVSKNHFVLFLATGPMPIIPHFWRWFVGSSNPTHWWLQRSIFELCIRTTANDNRH